MVPVVIATARLRLRPPSLDDAEEIFASYASDPIVTRYVRWRPHTSARETHTYRIRTLAAMEARTEVQWVIERLGVELPIGMIGFRFAGHAAELGYVIARDCWRQGFATEAARPLSVGTTKG